MYLFNLAKKHGLSYNYPTMQELTKQLEQAPIIYVTRDIERALGLVDTPNYYIISNYNESFKNVDNNILFIKEDRQLDTWELLQHPETKKFISDTFNYPKKRDSCATAKALGDTRSTPPTSSSGSVGMTARIIVFKPTKQIEKICQENNWGLLNPSAKLSNKVEEKISQLDWLDDLKKYLPDNTVEKCKNIKPFGPFKHFEHFQPFILQFNRSHTGSGTILIESDKQLEEIKNKFPDREARLVKYIDGPIFTNNNIVAKNKTLLGNINYQITGLQPFTDLPFATIGNDWGFPHKYLTGEQIAQYKKIVTDIGDKLRRDGWKGLFGVDVVVEESTGKLYLIEINARQPASTTYESQLQSNIRITPPEADPSWSKNDYEHTNKLTTTFEAHLASLLDIDLSDYNLIEIKNGAQIISRLTTHITHNNPTIIEKLKKEKLILTEYNNTKPGSDLLRIQSQDSIIKAHNEFNELGKKILDKITI